MSEYDIEYGKLYRLKKHQNTYPEYIYTIHTLKENSINDDAFDRIRVVYLNDYHYNKLIPTMYKWEISRYYELVNDE